MKPVHAAVVYLLLSGPGSPIAAESSSVHGDPAAHSKNTNLPAVCPILTEFDSDSSCYIDSFGLVSKPRDFCGARVISFGYLAMTWGQFSLYPDEARANAQFIATAISLGNHPEHRELTEMVDETGGFYAEVIGQFICHERSDLSSFGVGAMKLERVSVFDEKQDSSAPVRVLYRESSVSGGH